MIKLLLVDDHKIIRDGIKALMHGNKEVEVIGECSNGIEVIRFLETNQPDVILMDINMPLMNGIECCEAVAKKYKSIKIIALTMHNEESYISKMLKAGAHGYVLKNSDMDELILATKEVVEKGIYYSKDVSDIMMMRFMKKETKSKSSFTTVEDLTEREIDVLRLISEGLTNNQIADKLIISARTVDTHRRNLLQKIGVNNTAGLVRFAFENLN